MKKLVKVEEIAAKQIKKLGFKIMSVGSPNANGPDIYASKNGKPFSFEVKSLKKTARNSYQTNPVEKNRINDNFIAVVFPSGYVLIEPMKAHLNSCTKMGYRTLTELV